MLPHAPGRLHRPHGWLPDQPPPRSGDPSVPGPLPLPQTEVVLHSHVTQSRASPRAPHSRLPMLSTAAWQVLRNTARGRQVCEPQSGVCLLGEEGPNPLHTPTCLYPEHVTTDLLMSWGALLFRPHRKRDTRTGRQCDSCCRQPVTACTGIRCCLPLLVPPLRSPQGQCEGTRDPLLLGRSPAAHPQPRQTRTQHHMVEPAQKAIRPHALKWAGWSILLNVHLTTITKWEKGHRCTEQYSPHGINETL